jgi:PAS domain S-box-containing protein
MVKNESLRRFGCDLVGDVPWGTHLCQFYENKQDLIDILVPYFVEGLKNNEFCMWVTSPPLGVEEAREALSKVLPNLGEYFSKGQIEIIPYDKWYLLDGKFDSNRVLQGWVQKEKDAIQRGFDGLRLTGNTFWIERPLWSNFVDYEKAVNDVIDEHKMLALCTYCLKNCSGTDVVEVMRNHVGTLIKQDQKWSLVENVVLSKKAEQAIRQSEERFSKAFNSNPAAISISRLSDGLLSDVNDTYLQLFEFSREEVIGHISTELNIFTSPNERAELTTILSEKGAVRNLDVNFQTKTGKPFNAIISIDKMGVNGEDYAISTIIDVTERKKMEQAVSNSLEESQLRESEISALLKASRTVLQNKEFQHSSRAIFDACKELLGATAGYVALLSDNGRENIVLFLDSGGLPCTVDPSLPMPIRGLRAEAYNSSKVAIENDFPQSEWQKFSPEGHVQLDNVLFAPLTIEQRTVGVIGLANKIGGFTRRDTEMAKAFGELASVALANSKMLEMLEENEKELKMHSEHLERLVEERTKQLKDSERLAAIGATAGMVGHDIRNPLQAITGDVYLLKTELVSMPESEDKKSVIESLDGIEKNIDYINKIVADLQDFARPLNPHFEETDLKIILDKLLKKNGLPENVKVSVKVESEVEKFRTDSAHINRILYNLVNNALQAMPQGGNLTIHVYKKSNDTVITVKDTGVGIPEAVKGKLFAPMFTTKSRGQGFGLPVVKRMTESLGGTVSFESQEGKGTTFIIRLPQKSQR